MAPQDVALSNRQRTLTITWEDGTVSVLPIHYLRGWCPCAACQGHTPTIRFRETDPELTIDGMYEAGAYALHLRFSDGHDSGIYSWEWLRRLSPDVPPEGLKQGAFAGGRFVEKP